MTNHVITPVHLMVLLHYHVNTNQMPQIQENVPAFSEAAGSMLRRGMLLEVSARADRTKGDATLALTEKGKFYLEYLLATPLPGTKYFIPDRT